MKQDSLTHSWDSLRGELIDGGASRSDLDRFDAFVSRRQFFGWAGRGGAAALLATLGAGPEAALRGLFGRGLVPVALGQEGGQAPLVPGKPEMTILIPNPINGEFAPHLLDDDVTPSSRHFVRNSGGVPERALAQNPRGWKLTIDGEVHRPLELSLDDLRKMKSVSLPMLIECAGNGRARFDPPVRGNPWRGGAVACAKWTGVPLRDVLSRAGLKDSAKYTAHYGEDPPIGQMPPFSRGIPLDKAMEPHTIVAYAMNDKPLTPTNGYPVRLVVPGWVGSASQKWLNRIWIRDREHDSQKMTGYSYRIPKYPVAPGSRPPESDMKVVTAWSVKSMITRPATNAEIAVGSPVAVAGHAWAGESKVERVRVSTDFGCTWSEAKVHPPPNKYAWQRWEASVTFPRRGYYEIWSQAIDDRGEAQPMRQPWNPRGYLYHAVDRLPIRAKG